jgi:uncharacterized membrane protein
MGPTSGTGTVYPLGVHPRFLVGFVLFNLLFSVYVLYIVVCVFVLLFLAIVLSVRLRSTTSHYHPLWFLKTLLIAFDL